jgi:hypothetical protein
MARLNPDGFGVLLVLVNAGGVCAWCAWPCGGGVPMSAERQSKRPEAAGEHPAERFAREVGAQSVVLPSPPRHERNAYAKADVSKIWALYGPERPF